MKALRSPQLLPETSSHPQALDLSVLLYSLSKMVLTEGAGPAAAQLIGCIICLPPLIVQVQQRNLACSILLLSTVIFDFMDALNALIWGTSDVTSWWDGRVFCDIEIRLYIGLEVSITGAVTCIFRQLSMIFGDSPPLQTKSEKRRKRSFEIMLCIVAPVIRMGIFYVVQPDRYLIMQLRGCVWTFDSSWLGVLLMFSWQIILSLTALVYATLTAIRLFRHRRNTNPVLGQTGNQHNTTRIIRLCSFAVILFLLAVPVQIYLLYYTLPRNLEPFSWSRVHPPDWSDRIFMLAVDRTGIANIRPFLSIFYSCGIAIVVALAPDSLGTYKIWLAALRKWARHMKKKTSTRSSITEDIRARQQRHDHAPIPTHYELAAITDRRSSQEAL